MTIAGALRRLYWAIRWKFQPIPIIRPMEAAPALPPFSVQPGQLHVTYPKPAGGGWILLSDWILNQRMQNEGNGWPGMCAVEIWRADWAKSSAVFSSWLMSLNRDQAVGLYWRPLPHGGLIPTTVQ